MRSRLPWFVVLSLIVFGTLVLIAFFTLPRGKSELRRLLGGIFFTDSITEGGLKEIFSRAKRGGGTIKILIVPGHDDEVWGTEYRGLREADLTRLVGKELADFLRNDPAFTVILTRDEGGYTPDLATYFKEESEQIKEFRGRNVGITDIAARSGAIAHWGACTA